MGVTRGGEGGRGEESERVVDALWRVWIAQTDDTLERGGGGGARPGTSPTVAVC